MLKSDPDSWGALMADETTKKRGEEAGGGNFGDRLTYGPGDLVILEVGKAPPSKSGEDDEDRGDADPPRSGLKQV